ncbi:MAG: hypothetical protein R2789_01320 [Microthrixaceae bacterium]
MAGAAAHPDHWRVLLPVDPTEADRDDSDFTEADVQERLLGVATRGALGGSSSGPSTWSDGQSPRPCSWGRSSSLATLLTRTPHWGAWE